MSISEVAKEEPREVYINAVCGAGKTEIILSSIEQAIGHGQRVGFVIPRKEVVKEIYERLKQLYPALNITAVYGGHNEYLDGDIIVLTAHQCYRYNQKFGLMILDEYDAFPLKGDQVLLNIVNKTCFGKRIYLSATFSKEELLGKHQLTLARRYHNFDLQVPKVFIGSQIKLYLKLLVFLICNRKNTVFVFTPTIKVGERLTRMLKIMFFRPELFTSKSVDKSKKFKQIKNKEINLVVTTTVLERGITVKNLQVVVYLANHDLFDYRTLIQISGRTGRKYDAPLGQVLFLATGINYDIERSIKEIVDKNNQIK